MKNKGVIILLILLAVIILVAGRVGLFGKNVTNSPVNSAPPEESAGTPTPVDAIIAEKEQISPSDPYIKINNELQKVSFCAVDYQTKQILINGIDVMKRLADIGTKQSIDLQKRICEIHHRTLFFC